MEIWKQLRPEVRRIAVIYNPKTAPGRGSYYLRLVAEAARTAAVEVVPTPVENAAEIERAILAFAQVPHAALLILPEVTTNVHRKLIVELAAREHLPAVYGFRHFVDEGGLASYGIDITDMYRRAALYVDRILRGAVPDQLPVQAPVKFELVVNSKTANALGLTIPLTLLTRADDVIE